MKKLLLLALFISSGLLLQAQLQMPYIFSDHMMLQRGTHIPVWGTSLPGTHISVQLATQKTQTVCNKEGKWMVKFSPQAAGGPYELIIFEGDNVDPSIVFEDVLIGDVWFASGQSNMEWQVQQANGADKEIAKANNPNLRFFNVPHNKTLSPQTNTKPASWKVCDSNSVKEVSAVGYYFIKKLEKENGVPVGILQASWGGTPVEAWTSRDMLLSDTVMCKKVLQHDTLSDMHFIQDSLDLITFWDIVYNPKNNTDKTIPQEKYNDKKWSNFPVPGLISHVEPEFYEGMIWLRKTIQLAENFTEKDLTINLGHPEMNYSLYFNGTEICKTQWNANLSHSYTIPAGIVKKGDNTIAVRFAALWGGGGLNPPADSIYLSNGNEKFSLTGNWKYKIDLETRIPKIHNYHQYPTFLYNAMINPVVPFGIKGFIWYQGEHNEGEAYYYRHLFPRLINDWRIRFKQGYLPFLFVQLPNYYDRAPLPSDGRWAVLRESQTEALRLPNTGMACIIDLGLAENIHPTNKTEVGNRLADVAQKVAYHKNIVASGPVFESFKVKENKVTVTFKSIGEGLRISEGEKVTGFALAGSDQKFYWANATIEENKVILSSDKVENPVAVRYAWANNPECNLINSKELPAVPFRTDNWTVVTQ